MMEGYSIGYDKAVSKHGKATYPTTNILHPFSVLMTATQLLNAYPTAAVKTLESAVNHDQCSNTMKPLAFGDEAGKYKRCCPSLITLQPQLLIFQFC